MVAVVVVIAASIGAATLGFGDRLSSPAPNVVFESEINENITIRHNGGDTIDGSKIEIRGGTIISISEELRSGDIIKINPSDDVDKIEVVWISGERSAILYSINNPRRGSSPDSEPTGPEPSPPPKGSSGVQYVSSDSNSVIDANGDTIVIEDGVTQSGNINNPGSVFIGTDATMTEPVGASGDIVLQPGATIQNNINSGENLYLLPGSKVTGDVNGISGNIYLQDQSQIEGNINQGNVIIEYD